VATGDLSENGHPDSYRRLGDKLRTAGTPVHVVAGNHDDATVLYRELPGGTVSHRSRIDLDAWTLLVLDTSVPGAPHGALDADALATLAADLEATAGRPKIVFMHHPPFDIGSPWLDAMALLDRSPLLGLLDGQDVRAIACGHVHQAQDQRWNEVSLLTTPSTGSQALPGAKAFVEDQRPAGFRWFELEADGSWRTGIERIARSARSYAVSTPP